MVFVLATLATHSREGIIPVLGGHQDGVRLESACAQTACWAGKPEATLEEETKGLKTQVGLRTGYLGGNNVK